MTDTRQKNTVLARQLWFSGNAQIEIRTRSLLPPAAGEVLVRNLYSAVSAGTEMLVYRGQLPEDMALDATLASMHERPCYPLQYGYASVGRVEQLGAGVEGAWQNRLVFSFTPHVSHFIAMPSQLILLPKGVEAEAAVFLANMETAVNLVQDGRPALGERVLVLGQGIVGLLLSALLTRHPLALLCALDAIPARRERALQLGVARVCDPFSSTELARLRTELQSFSGAAGADLIYEVSGAPEALNTAIDLSGFASRIVIGSWYGSKSAAITLGGSAHRNRLQISTSQVSTLAPGLSGRWDKNRRFDWSWEMIRRLQPQQLITHRVPFEQAADIYRLLHESPAEVLQAVFVHD